MKRKVAYRANFITDRTVLTGHVKYKDDADLFKWYVMQLFQGDI